MRHNQIGLWAVILLLASVFLTASNPEYSAWSASRHTRLYRVAILPVCNLGTYCDPDLPRRLGQGFFRLSNGVASFINEISEGQAHVVGKTTPWIRPKWRLKSSQDLIAQSELVIELAASYLRPEDYDVFFIYGHIGTALREEAWPSGQILRIGAKELKPGLVFMINSDIFSAPVRGKLQSALSPSLGWARQFLRSIGLRGNSHVLNCQDVRHIGSCTIRAAKDPFSLLGEVGFSLAPSWPMKEALSWSWPTAVTKIEHDGSYQLDLAAKSSRSLVVHLPKPLKLNASINFDQLIIEPRPITRFDRTLRKLQSPEVTARFLPLLNKFEHGAFVYFGSSMLDKASTVLIDAHANSESVAWRGYGKSSLFAELVDTKLMPGQSFKVFDSPVLLKITRATASSLTVNIEGLSH